MVRCVHAIRRVCENGSFIPTDDELRGNSKVLLVIVSTNFRANGSMVVQIEAQASLYASNRGERPPAISLG